MGRQHWICGVLSLLAAVLVVGCDKPSEPAAGGQPEPWPKEIRLGYFPNLTHAQAVLGVASGDFEKAAAPAKFSTKIFNAGPSLIEALNAGQIDIGYIGPSPTLAAHAVSRGRAVRVIAGANANGVIIVARQGSGITRLEDLKGKRVATPQLGNTQDISAKHYLRFKLNQSDTSNVINIANAEQAAMMARDEIDASWAPEPWGSRLIVEAGAQQIAAEADLWPDNQFTLTVIITTPEFLAKHPDVVEKLLAVHLDWTRKLQTNPDAHISQLADALYELNKKRLPPGVLERAIKNVRFTEQPLADSFTTFAQWAYDVGAQRDPVNTDGLVDMSILNKLLSASPAPAKGEDAPQ
jgi:NitT/TauT family transport system substrate-binding protein